MEFFNSLKTFTSDASFLHPFLAFGKFDPLHLGHIHLLKNLISWAKDSQHPSVLLSFSNNPQAFLQKLEEPKPLLPIEIRKEKLSQLGLDAYLCIPFDEELSKISPEDFVQDLLVKQFQISGVLFGFNSRFGYKGKGNFKLLADFSTHHNFEAREFPEFSVKEESVSTFRIRQLLENGNIELANKLLGTPYTLYGSVMKGKQLGRTIQFPTANLKTEQFLPKKGVYGVEVELVESQSSSKIFKGVMNIGIRPTISSENFVQAEIHLLQFDGDLYGKNLQIKVLSYLREEKTFENLTLLKQQIQKDIQNYQEFLKKFYVSS